MSEDQTIFGYEEEGFMELLDNMCSEIEGKSHNIVGLISKFFPSLSNRKKAMICGIMHLCMDQFNNSSENDFKERMENLEKMAKELSAMCEMKPTSGITIQ